MGKKTMKNSENKPCHKIPVASKKKEQKQQISWRLNSHKVPVASKKKKEQTRQIPWRLRRQQELEGLLRLGLDRNDESVQRLLNETKDICRQRMLARKLVKIPINLSLIPPDRFCKETNSLLGKMRVRSRENVPETVLGLLKGRLMAKFGRSYEKFVSHLWKNIWLKVHLRCLQDDAGVSDLGMAEMHPLQQLLLLDGGNTVSGERKMKVLVSEFGLNTPCSYPVEDIITELVEKMVKAFAEVAPKDAMAAFAEVAHQDAMAHAMQGISLAQ